MTVATARSRASSRRSASTGLDTVSPGRTAPIASSRSRTSSSDAGMVMNSRKSIDADSSAIVAPEHVTGAPRRRKRCSSERSR